METMRDVTVTMGGVTTHWDEMKVEKNQPSPLKFRTFNKPTFTARGFIPTQRVYSENRATRRAKRFGKHGN